MILFSIKVPPHAKPTKTKTEGNSIRTIVDNRNKKAINERNILYSVFNYIINSTSMPKMIIIHMIMPPLSPKHSPTPVIISIIVLPKKKSK